MEKHLPNVHKRFEASLKSAFAEGAGDWVERKLGEVCVKTSNIRWQDCKNEIFKYIDLSAVSRDALKITCSVLIDYNNAPSRAKKIVKKNDVIFATTRPTLKRIAKIYGEYDDQICSTGFVVLRAERGEICPKMIFYFLQTSMFMENMEKLQRGASYPAVSDNDVKNQRISFPKSLKTQKQIVKILDEVFGKIEIAKKNAEKNLQNAKELFESYLQSIFANGGDDWEDCALNDHVKFIDYRGRTPQKTSSGLRLITAKNIKMGFLQRTPEEFVNPNIYGSWMTRGIPKKGDVLFTTEAPLANVAQLDTDEKVVFAQRTIIFQPNAEILNKKFLKYLLLSQVIQKRILEKGTGATVKGIKASILKKIIISFPLLSIQKQIVAKLDRLSIATKKLEKNYQQKIADLEELKKSILQKAFAGEL